MAEDTCSLIQNGQRNCEATNSNTGNEAGEDRRNSVEQPPRMRTRYLVVLCILFVELCERLTFYGVTANLVFYCKDILKLTSPLPSTITLAFQGMR